MLHIEHSMLTDEQATDVEDAIAAIQQLPENVFVSINDLVDPPTLEFWVRDPNDPSVSHGLIGINGHFVENDS